MLPSFGRGTRAVQKASFDGARTDGRAGSSSLSSSHRRYGSQPHMESHLGRAEPIELIDGRIDHAELLEALQAMRNGDFSARLPGDRAGIAGKIADTFNDLAIANQHLAAELVRVADSVGRHGRTRERVRCARTIGAWGDVELSLDRPLGDLLVPTTEV